MTEIRVAVVEKLANTFGCQHFDIHTMLPWLKQTTGPLVNMLPMSIELPVISEPPRRLPRWLKHN
jgi:hypothetical protein